MYAGNIQNVRVFPSIKGTFPNLNVTWDAIASSKVNYYVSYSTFIGSSDEPPSNAICITVWRDSNDTQITLDRLDKGTTYYIWIAGTLYGEKGNFSTRASGTTYEGACIYVPG